MYHCVRDRNCRSRVDPYQSSFSPSTHGQCGKRRSSPLDENVLEWESGWKTWILGDKKAIKETPRKKVRSNVFLLFNNCLQLTIDITWHAKPHYAKNCSQISLRKKMNLLKVCLASNVWHHSCTSSSTQVISGRPGFEFFSQRLFCNYINCSPQTVISLFAFYSVMID